MSSSIVSPFPFFTDTTGAPLEGGYIYIGQSNLNPETAPVNVFWDAALTIPAAQPVRTVGGYPSRQGTPSRFYSATDTYSITVRNKNHVLVFSAFDQSDAPTSVFDISTQLITATAGQTTFTLTVFSYLPGTDTLQVFRNGLRLNLGLDYLETNSVTITLTAPAALGDQFLFQGGAVITGDQTPGSAVSFIQAGAGAITRNMQDKVRESVSVLDFGAVGDGVTDDTAAIQAAINYVASLPRGGRVYYPKGRYRVTSTIYVSNPLVSQCGDGILSSLIVTTTNISTMIIGSNPIESLEGVDILGVGFYHTNSVAKTNPHLTLICVEQSTFNVSIGNGQYGIVVYGGQGIIFDRVFAPGNYVSGSPTLNSAEGIMLRSASEAAGYTLGSSAVDLPTEVNFKDIYINGPRVAGWQYGVSIYAGEHITFSGVFYVGQCTVNNIHIEQQATNKLILEVKLEKGGYIDAAGTAGVWIGGPSGNGSQYIGSISIACDIKGQGGDGLKGIYVDGTSRGGSFPQAVRNLSITGNVSGFSGNGIEIGGGVNIDITGAKVWGNSFLSANQGSGLVLGPSVTVCNVTGGHFGGGTYGDGTGNQTYGISVDTIAFRVTLNGVDLRGNQAALNWTNNAESRLNQVFNCAGFNGNRPAAAPSMAASGADYVNPFGSPASVLIFGGTVSSIKLNGQQMFNTTVTAPIFVGMNDVLNVTYTVAPSWIWWPQ